MHTSTRYNTVAHAMRRSAAPALGVIAFLVGCQSVHRALVRDQVDGIVALFAWARAVHSECIKDARRLRAERDQLVATLVENQRKKRDEHGKFLPVKPLKQRLVALNAALAAA